MRRLGLALPPQPMALHAGTRPLKRWRYVGVFTPELMLCVGEARIGPLPLRWWAVALPDGSLFERTTNARRGVRIEGSRVSVAAEHVGIELELGERGGVETASAAGASYIWTRKQAGVPVRGQVTLGGLERRIEGPLAVVDDSAGYHPRRTEWQWSAGVGTSDRGEQVGWNLVEGVHDSPRNSERTLWIDGRPRELGPVAFAADLSAVGGLRFTEWSAREDHTNLLLVRSDYRQPFGSFEGEVGGVRLVEGHGVMERHEARW